MHLLVFKNHQYALDEATPDRKDLDSTPMTHWNNFQGQTFLEPNSCDIFGP